MQLTDGERLIIAMLCDVMKGLGAKGEFDPEFVAQAIYSGNTWALTNKYSSVFGGTKSDKTVREVYDILDMWAIIEAAGGPSFPGFDGNEETEHASIARFITNSMDQFSDMKGRVDHGVMQLEDYRHMYAHFEGVRNALGSSRLSGEQLQELLKLGNYV